LANELVEGGAIVTVIDKNPTLFGCLNNKISKIEADVTKPKSYSGLDNHFEYVFHLAARTDIDGTSVEDYFENYEGTEKILKWLDSKSLVRFVLYSTQLAVGLFNETRFIDESEPYRTKTVYGESKILAEKIVKKYCKEKLISYVILRPTSVYGPYGKEPYRDYFKAIKNGRYFNIGRADNLISLCYVKNLVDLTLILGVSKGADKGVFYGNDFHPYTMREFSDTVAKYYGVNLITLPYILVLFGAYFLGFFKYFGFNVPLYPFRLRNLVMNYCYDIKNSVELGYLPKYDLADGVKETLDWYEKNKT